MPAILTFKFAGIVLFRGIHKIEIIRSTVFTDFIIAIHKFNINLLFYNVKLYFELLLIVIIISCMKKVLDN